MDSVFATDSISHVIQLAVAPVFMLAGISGALNVLSLRMGRIIDRGRKLNELEQEVSDDEEAREIDEEQLLLSRRARLIHRAIALCNISALFVSLVIVSLFIDALFTFGMQWFIAALFIIALSSLIIALLYFLREIDLSINAFRFGAYRMTDR